MTGVEVLIRGGTICDLAGDRPNQGLAIHHGTIIDTEARSPAADTVIDATGQWILPGLVDPHVHLSASFGCQHGHQLLARAGVTTAIDFAGPLEDVTTTMRAHGAGLTIGVLNAVAPEQASQPPDRLAQDALRRGALGLKVLGGHFPLPPTAVHELGLMARQRPDLLLAVHAGTTRTPGNFEGFCEAVELLRGSPAYLAHLNSYVRGETAPVTSEIDHARQLLVEADSLLTEVYLATINGSPGHCRDGELASAATARHLRRLGYQPTPAGLRNALGDQRIWVADPHADTGLSTGAVGLAAFDRADTVAMVCLPVNNLGATLALAASHRPDASWLVSHFCSDGGGIPRNLTWHIGLTLVDWGVLTLTDLITRAVRAPAAMLGLNRGLVQIGAVADLALLDPTTKHVTTTLARGHLAFDGHQVHHRPGRLLITDHAQRPPTGSTDIDTERVDLTTSTLHTPTPAASTHATQGSTPFATRSHGHGDDPAPASAESTRGRSGRRTETDRRQHDEGVN